MDAARTAQRLTGRPTTVVYRRSRAEMPAEEEEVRDLLSEGNRLEELLSPIRIEATDGRVCGLVCLRNRLGEPGADGRRRPIPLEGSEVTLPASGIILAVGQRADLAFLDGTTVVRRKDGRIVVNQGGRTGAGHVYAGGDVSRGPAIIVEACADGQRAAAAICGELAIDTGSVAYASSDLSEEEIRSAKRARARRTPRHDPERRAADERRGFDLVERTLSCEAAHDEATRCLQCATICDKCVEVCPNRANVSITVSPLRCTLPILACRDGRFEPCGEEPLEIDQRRQIVHIDDLCNECGNCATFCVHQGRPYADKPRLFLTEEAFLREADNAFFVEGSTLRRRERGEEARLTVESAGMAYDTPAVRMELSEAFEVLRAEAKPGCTRTVSLVPAAEMAVLFEGLRQSAAFLLDKDSTPRDA